MVALGVNNNDNFNINTNDNINNNRPALGIATPNLRDIPMKTYKNLYGELCSYENLERAYEKAKHHKTSTKAAIEFEKNWQPNLCTLMNELREQTYTPQSLRKFILRDPKTRTICVSDFRDRIIHHALINILQPIFEPRFIHDSYASRRGKGTLPAIKRLDKFMHKVTKNGRLISTARNANQVQGYALKADIKHYFDTVDHNILLNIIAKRIKDSNVLWLTQVILDNYNAGLPSKGMPLGNWTSQFFANIYLNELDQYVKHQLKAKQYIRYVDDFIILHQNKMVLAGYENRIKSFLQTLQLELHPEKCKIISLSKGISFLGFRTFYHHKLILQRNLRKIHNKLKQMLEQYKTKSIDAQDINETLHGWNAYAKQANTYKLRTKLTQTTQKQLNTTQTPKKTHWLFINSQSSFIPQKTQ